MSNDGDQRYADGFLAALAVPRCPASDADHVCRFCGAAFTADAEGERLAVWYAIGNPSPHDAANARPVIERAMAEGANAVTVSGIEWRLRLLAESGGVRDEPAL